MAKLSDERIAVLKALFDKYVDIASWHRPSVILLDNLDRVIGPEVEVSYLGTVYFSRTIPLYIC